MVAPKQMGKKGEYFQEQAGEQVLPSRNCYFSQTKVDYLVHHPAPFLGLIGRKLEIFSLNSYKTENATL